MKIKWFYSNFSKKQAGFMINQISLFFLIYDYFIKDFFLNFFEVPHSNKNLQF